MDFFKRLQPFALLVMRVALGAIMIAHGYKKVFGGLHGYQQMLAGLGLPPWMAYLPAIVEFFGGIAIVLGPFTQFFSLAFLIEMMVAIWKVHWKNGLMGVSGHPERPGFEFPLALVAIAFALMCFGAGPYALTFGGRSSGWGGKK